MTIEDKVENMTMKDKAILKEIKKSGMNDQEIIDFIKALQKQKPIKIDDYSLGNNKFKFLYITDSHIGNIHYDSKLNTFASKIATKEKVDAIIHTGDVVDGWYQNRPSSIFEQNAIGFDQQLKMAVDELKKFKQPLYFITGNHENNTFMRNTGAELGYVLEDKLVALGKKAKFLGNAHGVITLNNGTKIQLIHPDGGSSYALSYKSQKIIESLEGGTKPNILLIGHFHKAEYIYYRNIHCYQGGTLCSQTEFMKNKGLSAHKGFWIIDVSGKANGEVDVIGSKFYPAYK